MSLVRQLHDEIAVVGWACRLPGANTVEQLWSLLLEGKCTVSRVPPDRFPANFFEHPRRQERGRSVSFAAGIIDDVWGFDPSVFGIAPREAAQIDPQQRILLQLTWEALEDAGIPASSIAGNDVGVFMGASIVEYANVLHGDPSIADSHFATGNALSTISNRISYIFNLHGPSITVDTACSSSLVAMHQAMEALRSGRIDTAIVGGINIIASPYTFITFSQASMLSPTGLCQAFSAEADGFVRAEGGAVLILRKSALANAAGNPFHATLIASDVNSDGRTNGISFPSSGSQRALLERIYSRAGINPQQLAFLEAHGTGTQVGDPAEARAIGEGLARARSTPLPIGSIKTNVGHLEAASGMAGLLKAMLALQHGVLPKSLHFQTPNRNIDFDALNLRVCNQPLLLKTDAGQCAGVSSFGFGGTNAHVVIGPGRRAKTVAQPGATNGNAIFSISAASKEALSALARAYAERIDTMLDGEIHNLAGAAAHRREQLAQRAVISTLSKPALTSALQSLAKDASNIYLTTGEAVGKALPVAFVYSGNGSQWPGMGCSAYRLNRDFRRHFDKIDSLFTPLAGWSLKAAMFDLDAKDHFYLTRVAQPLIFAIQSASTAALRALGLNPSAVCGHSVGEIAAAEAAGILDLNNAVRVIYYRSLHQEKVRGGGSMAAILASPEHAKRIIAPFEGVEIAAFNSPNAVTVAGPAEAMTELQSAARQERITILDLDLPYPFHTAAMEQIKNPLLADLSSLNARASAVPFVSSVTGTCIPGERMNGNYWWQNIREPVRFSDTIREAAREGARCFLEIGPRGMLGKHISDCLEGETGGFTTLNAIDRTETETDPFMRIVAHALVSGVKLDTAAVIPPDPGPGISLPAYPWQQESFRFENTAEAFGFIETERHPFRVFRITDDGLEWHCFVDIDAIPSLAGHKVGQQVIFPGTAFLELAFLTIKQFLQTDKVSISHFEILRPLDLTSGKTREVVARISPGSATIEILSRLRLAKSAWQLHCRGKIGHALAAPKTLSASPAARGIVIASDRLYELAEANGLHYGSAFRNAHSVRNFKDREIRIDLSPTNTKPEYLLDPMRLDACFHGMITLFPRLNTIERGVTYIPTRLDKAILFAGHGIPATAIVRVIAKNERSILMDFAVFDQDGQPLATLTGVRAQATQVRRQINFNTIALLERCKPVMGSLAPYSGFGIKPADIIDDAIATGSILPHPRQSEARILLEGWAAVIAYQIISAIPDNQSLDLELLAITHRIDPASAPWLLTLLRRLSSVGLAHYDGHKWKLNRGEKLPDAASLVQELARKHPELAAELLIAGEITGRAAKFLEGETVSPNGFLSAASREFYRISNITLKSAIEKIIPRVRFVFETHQKRKTLRVLQVGHNALTNQLAALFKRFPAEHTVFEPNDEIFEDARTDLQTHKQIELLGPGETLKPQTYDLIVSAHGLTALSNEQLIFSLNRALAVDGVLIVVEPQPALIHDLLAIDLARHDNITTSATGSVRGIQGWTDTLKNAGFSDCSVHLVDCITESGLLIVASGKYSVEATIANSPSQDFTGNVIALPCDSGSALSKHLRHELSRAGRKVSVLSKSKKLSAETQNQTFLIHTRMKGGESVKSKLAARCLSLKAALDQIGTAKTTIWFVFYGALQSTSGEIDPVETGAWAFARVAANEYPNLDIRRVDVALGQSPKDAAKCMRHLITNGGDETEIQIEGADLKLVRMEYADQVPAGGVETTVRAQLQKRQHTPQRVAWTPVARDAPKSTEVEIEVAATGLNFRDLMWTLDLLPDDILEDGYTGPTLGLECAGKVIRAGSKVDCLKAGDRVVTFAPAAFSTHVTLPASQVLSIPASMTYEAASTVPVAFLTAYYGLISLAKLKGGQWVLIHAAAGGVGLAAVQTAQACGARIIATAGSEAKRDMLRSLGVDHVLDSRSNDFVSEILAITDGGVDVVLNSLAGEAMELSIECLRPFGRFIELGKRDYVGNTHIGLRPFRRNLSYFGVDVDQLLLKNRNSAARLFRIIMSLFDKGTYKPLPHSVFPADDIGRAFQLMQKSRHIGKIVVTPPEIQNVKAVASPFSVNPKATHLITGAFGGFGLETAKWLVERGAKNLVLLGRSGAASSEAKETLAQLRKRGIRILESATDVSDGKAMDALFGRIAKSMPPLCGVVHAAMVLDDALIANLNGERIEQVLAPKVEGAEHLDRLTRKLPLEYFVMFSSFTTMIGNPGQASYVAANAYMEGLARRRRKIGLPSLAIGWGPITDVGVLARNERLQENLAKLTRVKGMTSREALDLMASAIEQSRLSRDFPVIAVASNDGNISKERLKLLHSPTFKVFSQTVSASEDSRADIDLRDLLRTEKLEIIRVKVTNVIVSHIAKVLRFRESDISHIRPIGEMGLDSLLALELSLSLENAFGILIPLSGSGELTVLKIADEIIAQASSETAVSGDGSMRAAITSKHISGRDENQAEIIDAIIHDRHRQQSGQFP